MSPIGSGPLAAVPIVDSQAAAGCEASAPAPADATIGSPPAAANAASFCAAADARSLAVDADGLGAAIDAFLATVVKLAGARAGAVRSLVTPEGVQMRLVASVGLPDAVREREALVGACGVCGEALRGDRVHVADTERRCSRLASDERVWPGNAGTVAVPLDFRGRTVGVFTLFFGTVNEMRAEVIHLLRPLGQLLGLMLENARLQRAELEAELMQERQAMAAEIHDSLAQSLAFVRMRMPLVRHASERGDRDRNARYCDDIDAELDTANRRLRELITHFRAGMDSHGLVSALQRLAASFEQRTGIALEVEAGDIALPAEREVQLYHIVQEALANVFKHSGARHARVSLAHALTGLDLTIEDDGAGYPAALLDAARKADGTRADSFGLQIMGERARALGGRLLFENLPGGGARVRLFVPDGAACVARADA